MSLSISVPAVRLVGIAVSHIPDSGEGSRGRFGVAAGCCAYQTSFIGECIARREQMSENGREVANNLTSTFEAGSVKALAPAVRGYDAVYCWVEDKRKSGSHG